MEKNVIRFGCVYDNPNNRPESGRGAVYSGNGYSPTVLTMSGGGNYPMVIIREIDTYEKQRN